MFPTQQAHSVARRRAPSSGPHRCLEATDLDESHMPRLLEGTDSSGTLRPPGSRALGPARSGRRGWRWRQCGRGGRRRSNRPRTGALIAGTSGVIFSADEEFRPNPARAMHAFCHCLPRRWHEMSVMLSAAACVDWVARLTGYADVSAALADARAFSEYRRIGDLPAVSFRRTDATQQSCAQGVFFGLTHDTTPAALVRAVLEGVAFALADGADALREAGVDLQRLSVIGGGSRSSYWGRLLAAALQVPLDYRAGGELGPAYGAARLARLAFTNESPAEVCVPPPIDQVIEPESALVESLEPKRATFPTNLFSAQERLSQRPIASRYAGQTEILVTERAGDFDYHSGAICKRLEVGNFAGRQNDYVACLPLLSSMRRVPYRTTVISVATRCLCNASFSSAL